MDNLPTQNVRLREEMHAIRLEVNALQYRHAVDSSSKSHRLPVRLPMQTVEEIQVLNVKLENTKMYLLLFDYLSKLGGKSVSDCIGNLVRVTMTDDLAASVNWQGVNNRFSLTSTLFASAIVETVMRHLYVGVSQAIVREKVQRELPLNGPCTHVAQHLSFSLLPLCLAIISPPTSRIPQGNHFRVLRLDATHVTIMQAWKPVSDRE
ncbi:hypothetical protein EG68_07379 [Paragonimus skrjabini miyazakii]|uniref:DUF4806 domain-containing protein n=1 Tax=Paragonimus skrjabini miyazakii TaxID=59628 RepID=A0A8S9Z0V1_9TREM|nr:hypothetical protein EG68_07379 [Paragonimus skrjabini miyazakii]